jgi:hypothetical protein
LSFLKDILYAYELGDSDTLAESLGNVTIGDSKQLTPREAALLDNYQHTDDYGKGIIEATAFAAAESKQIKKRG